MIVGNQAGFCIGSRAHVLITLVYRVKNLIALVYN